MIRGVKLSAGIQLEPPQNTIDTVDPEEEGFANLIWFLDQLAATEADSLAAGLYVAVFQDQYSLKGIH